MQVKRREVLLNSFVVLQIPWNSELENTGSSKASEGRAKVTQSSNMTSAIRIKDETITDFICMR